MVKMNSICFIKLLVLTQFILVSCSHFYSKKSEQALELHRAEENQPVRCETKATIKDLTNGKNHRLVLDFLALGHSQMRIEISAVLGMGVASILFKNNETKYASYREKKFYQIQDSTKSLEPLFKLPLQPDHFFQLLYGQSIDGKDWQCDLGPNQLVKHCSHLKNQLTIDWKYLAEGRRTIQIFSPKTEVSWTFGAIQIERNIPEKAFELEAPQGFQIIRM